ncbi:MAG: hypothetical protein HONDAALG_01580 [Gammaproteobacteria bacterium]|nr:hypothetical protein [Gammaproteobacteria bacterium]
MSKLSLHPSVLLAWNIANHEACLSGSKRIEPIHFWYAILKILDDAFTQEAEQFDFTEEEIQSIVEILSQGRSLTELSDGEITTTRRRLRKELRDNGGVGNIRMLHRSETSRALFRRAAIRAKNEGADELSLTHLIEEIIAEHRRDQGEVDAFELISDIIQ